jgi:predicted GTPase
VAGQSIALVFVLMNKFTIIYPNGMRRHVNRLERDLLSSLTQIAPREYAAPSLQREIEQRNAPHFLPGRFTIEHGDRRINERLESVAAMTERLFNMGILELRTS